MKHLAFLLSISIPILQSASLPPWNARLEGVAVTFGPGRAPEDREGEKPQQRPFVTWLSGSIHFSRPLPKGAQPQLSLTLCSIQRPGPRNKKLQDIHISTDNDDRSLQFKARWPEGERPEERQLQGRIRIQGRRTLLVQSPIRSRFLPSAPPRPQNEGRE